MRGHLHNNIKKTLIIGAGFSGLITAYRLLQIGHSVEIFEKSDCAGGLIATLNTPYGIVETAAHSLRATPEVIDFFTELKVPLTYAKTKQRFIFRQGKCRKWPLTTYETATLLKNILTRRTKKDHITLADFGDHHLGHAATTHLLQPMAYGIFASDVDTLDRRAAFPAFTPTIGKTLISSLINNKQPKTQMISPLYGMADIVEKLVKFIQNHQQAKLHFNTPCEALPDFKQQNVVLTTPASITAMLLQQDQPRLSEALLQIRYQPLVTVTLFYKKEQLSKLGIGVLNSPSSNTNSLGILFNSSTFIGRVTNDDELSSCTIILGGSQQPNAISWSDEVLERAILQDMERILAITAPPVEKVITRWLDAIPLLSTDLYQLWQDLDHTLPRGLGIFGNYTGCLSLRQMILHNFSQNK
jgi:oxygen-dependent protoporphyrinogen oxidase